MFLAIAYCGVRLSLQLAIRGGTSNLVHLQLLCALDAVSLAEWLCGAQFVNVDASGRRAGMVPTKSSAHEVPQQSKTRLFLTVTFHITPHMYSIVHVAMLKRQTPLSFRSVAQALHLAGMTTSAMCLRYPA
jgi:hypothetical protein